MSGRPGRSEGELNGLGSMNTREALKALARGSDIIRARLSEGALDAGR